ncbi:unnamed protein product, partial [Rotaria magnacalcarata]
MTTFTAQMTIFMSLRTLLRHKPWTAAGRGHGKQSALDIWHNWFPHAAELAIIIRNSWLGA